MKEEGFTKSFKLIEGLQNLIEEPTFIEEGIESITKSTSLKGSLELICYGIYIIRNRST
jgi:hypothetical protein